MKEVEYVEHNQLATTADAFAQTCIYQQGADWGLTRTVYHQEWQISHQYMYNPSGKCGIRY